MSRLSDDKMWIHIHPTVEKTGRGRRVAIKTLRFWAIEYLKVVLKLKWSDKTFYKWWGKSGVICFTMIQRPCFIRCGIPAPVIW